MNLRTYLIAGAGFAVMAACVHTVKIEPSDKPIKIDLHITQEVRIIIDKQVEDMIADNPDLF